MFLFFLVFKTWGGNRTSIDILISQENLETLHQKLGENLIDYEILLEDLQEAIDEENPPMNPEEEEELENRQGWLSFNSNLTV